MKKLSLILLVIVGVIVLGYGRIYWQEQIAQMTYQNQESPKTKLGQTQPEATQLNELEFNMEYARNLPQKVIDKIGTAIENETPLQLTLVARNEDDWAKGVKEAILEVYGSNFWNIDIETYENQNISALLQNDSLQNLQADVIVFEGPFLNNNLEGPEWAIAFEELKQLINDWEEEAVVMIHPPNPIYGGVHFPAQVELYKNHLLEEEYLYLDHWSEWPDYNSEEILPYLDDNEGGYRWHVNPAGAKFWQDYLINYFIAE